MINPLDNVVRRFQHHLTNILVHIAKLFGIWMYTRDELSQRVNMAWTNGFNDCHDKHMPVIEALDRASRKRPRKRK